MSTSSNKIMDNMGGINKIYPIKTSDISSFNQISESQVNLFEVFALDKLDVDQESITFSEEHKRSSAGSYHETTLEALFLKEQLEVAQWVNNNQEYPFVVVMVYNNDIIKVAGTPDQPLRLTVNTESGSQDKVNGYGILFSGKTTKRAYYIDELPTILST